MSVISGNGRYVYYTSSATNLTSNGQKCKPGFFRYDIKTRKTIRLPLGKKYTRPMNSLLEGQLKNSVQAVSKSGRYIVFSIPTKNIKRTEDGEYVGDYDKIYRYDVVKKKALRIPNPNTKYHQTGKSGSSDASISGDGRYIVFLSSTKKDDSYNVFLFDCKSKKTKMVNKARYPKKYGRHWYHCTPSISPDGRYISYFFVHDNSATDSNYDLYLYDRAKDKRTAVAKFAFVGGDLGGEYYYGDIWNDCPIRTFTSQKARYIGTGILQYVNGYASYRIKVKK
jgi:Tol biopolymer transport system component